jgi:single-stranded DNA-binding protein
MTAHVLASGALFRAPEQRTSKAGKPFVTATIRVKDGDESQWWKVLAFSESVQAELMRLADGDAISVQGAFKAELYDKDSERRLSLSIVADNVLALRQPSKTRKAGERPQPATPADDGRPKVEYDKQLQT